MYRELWNKNRFYYYSYYKGSERPLRRCVVAAARQTKPEVRVLQQPSYLWVI